MAEKTIILENLTDTVARKLVPLEGDKRTYFRAKGNRNLLLSVSARGRMSWLYSYKPTKEASPRRDIIGYFPDMSCAKAKAKAAEITLGRAETGADPRTMAATPRRGPHAVTVNDVLDAYLAYLKGKKHPKENTLRNYTAQTRLFREHFGSRNYARAITPEVLGPWFQTHRLDDQAAKTTAIWMRAAHNHASKRTIGLLRNVPNPFKILIAETDRLRLPAGSHRRALSDDQMARLIAAIDRAKAIARGEAAPEPGIPRINMQAILAVELILYTGMRKEEARALDQDEIHGGLIILPEHKSDSDGPKEIPLTCHALRVLEEARVLRQEIGYTGKAVFPPANRANKDGYISALRNAALRLGWMAGITGSILKCHNVRSIYINYQRREGVDILQIGKNVGHKNPDVTRRHYVDLTEEERQESVKAGEAYIERMRALAAESAKA